MVQNNPGAGGLVTANKLYNSAEKDGSVIAKFERAVPQLQIQGDPNAQFDPTKFTWLGSLSSYANDAYLLLVNARQPVKSVEELRRPGMPLDARLRQLGLQQPDLRAHRQGDSRASTST